MVDLIHSIRGMHDVLPAQTFVLRKLEQICATCVSGYGYQEIRTPLLEKTQLFKRTIGEATDIVAKEMYSFADLNNDNLSLRPEGTAGCVRACLQHGLLRNQVQRLWYCGPMFRRERPQYGRSRQFSHFGVELFGVSSIAAEWELLSICNNLWQCLGIKDELKLEINNLGSLAERQIYSAALVTYLRAHFNTLDDDSKRRLEINPLRILDSKNPEMSTIIANAPLLIDFLAEHSKEELASFCAGLEQLGIDYVINPRLVRGLDYYSGIVFEWGTLSLAMLNHQRLLQKIRRWVTRIILL